VRLGSTHVYYPLNLTHHIRQDWKSMNSITHSKAVMLLLALAAFSLTPIHGLDYTPATLTLEVFADGTVDVEYTFEPDPTLATVNVTLMGEDYMNLLAADQDGLLLDWAIHPGFVEVDSLGSDEIKVSYSTQSLTNKTGSTWSVAVDAPVNHVLAIPAGAVLVELAPPPIDIIVMDNRAIITMPAGPSRVSYILGSTGTREHALVLLSVAEDAVDEAKLGGVVVDDAEAALAQARGAYDSGLYTQSEQYSTEASRLVQETVVLAGEADDAIQEAKTLIQSKQGKISQETIEAASGLIEAAEGAYAAGEYASALSSAEEAKTTLLDADEIGGIDQTLIIAGAALAALAAAGAFILRGRGQVEVPTRSDEPPVNVDLDAVFKDRPHLRTDDKAVLRFIQGKGGAFITEVRDHFNIPKSSAWRMARRLEEEGLLKVSTVGRETYFQLKKQEGQP